MSHFEFARAYWWLGSLDFCHITAPPEFAQGGCFTMSQTLSRVKGGWRIQKEGFLARVGDIKACC